MVRIRSRGRVQSAPSNPAYTLVAHASRRPLISGKAACRAAASATSWRWASTCAIRGRRRVIRGANACCARRPSASLASNRAKPCRPLTRDRRGLGRLGRRDPGVQSGLAGRQEVALLPTRGLVTSRSAGPVGAGLGGARRDRPHRCRGLRHPGGAEPARCTPDAHLQRLGLLRFSTGHDGLRAPAPRGCRQASPASAVRPHTRPQSRVEAVPAGGSSRTRRHFLLLGRKCSEPAAGEGLPP